MVLFPEVLETLGRLRERGVPLPSSRTVTGGSSGGRSSNSIWRASFDVILIEGEFGAGKPDDRVYRHVLEALRIRPRGLDGRRQPRVGRGGAPASGHARRLVDGHGAGVPATEATRPDFILRAFKEILDVVPEADSEAGTMRGTSQTAE
jgi:putative hydrolase of the HAD superfamily